tara:strand:+ start:523 stop:852 length:330 start_codon:yes stop_codon:yes gene_type:complete
MEELQLLVGMVADLPNMALWVIAFFFAYKVIILGSIFGIVKLAILKLHDWLTTTPTKVPLGDMCIMGSEAGLLAQIERVKRSTGRYVHDSDVDWLRKAIDMKEAADESK